VGHLAHAERDKKLMQNFGGGTWRKETSWRSRDGEILKWM